MVAGGAIVLLVDNVTDGSTEVTRLSTAVLGFLAGYSTEFLFQAIERVIAALLPRVGAESPRHAPAAPAATGNVVIGTATLNQLLQLHRDATDANDKAFYELLIKQLTGVT